MQEPVGSQAPTPVHGGYALGPCGGRTLEMGAFRMLLKADGAATAQQLTLLEAEEPPDFGPPLHIHDDAAEAFYVLEGEYRVFIAGQEYRCPVGSFVYVPAGVEHGFRVGSRRSRKLNIYVPSAMEGYFQALHDASAADGKSNDNELELLAASHGMRITGPVPENYV